MNTPNPNEEQRPEGEVPPDNGFGDRVEDGRLNLGKPPSGGSGADPQRFGDPYPHGAQQPGSYPSPYPAPNPSSYPAPNPTVPMAQPGPPQPGPPQPGPPQHGPPQHGSIQRQEPGQTQPRPPTVAEARARDKARKQAADQRQAEMAAQESRKRTRKRVMMGGAAVVGVAALVGGGYLGYRAMHTEKVTASCVKVENGKEVVVPDNYCGEGHPGYVSSPGLIVLGGGPQYRYNYGGTGTVGQPPVGGTSVKPKNAEIKTKTGTVIQRGGLGSKSTSGGS